MLRGGARSAANTAHGGSRARAVIANQRCACGGARNGLDACGVRPWTAAPGHSVRRRRGRDMRGKQPPQP
eukprot:7350973-Pyramimonas_sp.AAC.1